MECVATVGVAGGRMDRLLESGALLAGQLRRKNRSAKGSRPVYTVAMLGSRWMKQE